jgi:hypothetical protein
MQPKFTSLILRVLIVKGALIVICGLGVVVTGCDQKKVPDHQAVSQRVAADMLGAYRQKIANPDVEKPLEAIPEPVSGDRAMNLIFTHCCGCHREEGSAPFSLENYARIKRKASTIKRVVRDKIMPPWIVSSAVHLFVNEPKISDDERREIMAWIEQGAPPPTQDEYPVFNDSTFSNFTSGNRYLEYTWDGPMEIYSDQDIYQCFRLDMNLEEDIYVDMIEYISTNNSAVHHVSIFLEDGVDIDERAEGQECHKLDILDIATPVDTWTKGVRPMRYRDGLAYRIAAGSTLLLSVHYAAGFKGQSEARKMRLYLSDHPSPREVKWTVKSIEDISIPKGEVITDQAQVEIEHDYTLFGVMPHMHFLAKECKVYFVTPENRVEEVLHLNDWDYLWQSKYMLAEPVYIPAGSTIFMDVVYDNREENPTQPNDPVRDVKFGQTGNDEMLVLLLYGTDYKEGDEKITPVQIY